MMKSPSVPLPQSDTGRSENALLDLGFGYCSGEERRAQAPVFVIVVRPEPPGHAMDTTAITRPMTPTQLRVCLTEI